MEKAQNVSAVLLCLRLKGFADADVLAEASGRSIGVVEEVLRSAENDGWVDARSGSRSGWTMTAVGRSGLEQRLAAELAASGNRDGLEDGYERFLALNQPLLAVCTRWQVKQAEPVVLNDHSDPEYDRQVVDDLRVLHGRVEPVCDRLTAALSRFSGYRPRLSHALERVVAGDTEWFTKPTIDSYHTVWFELHEDLLVTLGRDRTSEH
jgi:hypothetical protein